MQSDLLQSKGTIYELKYKNDALKGKVAKYESEGNELRKKVKDEIEKNNEFLLRGEKYKAKVLEKERELDLVRMES